MPVRRRKLLNLIRSSAALALPTIGVTFSDLLQA